MIKTFGALDEAACALVGAVNPLRQVPALVLPSGETMTEALRS